MGVIYKLRPEIINFILEEKKTNPVLSCRSITSLVEKEFQVKVSKSSINSIIKKQGLSLPIGRRQKKRRRKAVSEQVVPQPVTPPPVVVPTPVPEPPLIPVPLPKVEEPLVPKVEEPLVEVKAEEFKETECTGAILLKAADYLIGGSLYFSQAIYSRLNRKDEDLLAKIESLIYLPLFEQDKQESILAYLNELQSVKAICLDLFRITSTMLQEVRCVKVNLSDGSIFYLDGQLHTIWSTPHIPHDFATTIYDIKSYINKYFYGDSPFILFMAPGYDIPTKEFFNFILSLDSKTKKITQLTLYNNNFEELEPIHLNLTKKQFFAFGLWPWQFVECRKVKKIGEFKPFYAELLNKEIYVAEVEIELTQPNIYQSVTLKGSALKTRLTEKTRLIILTNLADESVAPSQWLNLYLSHWPNFEEAFHDYSRKIELFTYTGTSRKFFSMEMLDLDRESSPDIRTIFNKYLEALDLYVRWHFLPSVYENKDFSTTKEHFYNLKALLNKEKDKLLVSFKPNQAFQFLKDLEYACRRLNEREITTPQNLRLWFSV